MPTGTPRYGPIIRGISNSDPGIVQVDNSFQIFENERIRLTAVVDDQSGSTLNGDYTVASVTNTEVTLQESTLSKATYISGGFMTVLTLDKPVTPNPPYDRFNNVPDYWNQANQI